MSAKDNMLDRVANTSVVNYCGTLIVCNMVGKWRNNEICVCISVLRIFNNKSNSEGAEKHYCVVLLLQVSWVSKEWAKRAALPSHVVTMLDNFPTNLHPMSQFSAAITALNSESSFARAYSEGVHKSKYWEVSSRRQAGGNVCAKWNIRLPLSVLQIHELKKMNPF